MRPDHKHDRVRRVKSSRARVQLTADLGWLSGFPVRQVPEGIVWRQCDPDQNPLGKEILLDRETIRRAEFTLNKLRHESGRILAHVVAESAQWVKRVQCLLDRFKSAIHTGMPLPPCLLESIDSLPVRMREMRDELLRQYPSLESLYKAISWRLYLEPLALRSFTVWLASNGRHVLGVLEKDSTLRLEEKLAWVMSLWHLANRHGTERTARLIRYLGEPRFSATPFAHHEYIEFLHLWTHRLNRFQSNKELEPVPELPSATLADQVHAMAIWIAQQPKAKQSHALDLFNLLVEDELLDEWHSFAVRVKAAVALARRMTGASSAAQFEQWATKIHSALFHDLAEQEMPDIRLQKLTETLESLCKPALSKVREELLRTLPYLSCDSCVTRARLDFCDAVLARCHYDPGPRVACALSLFRKYLSVGNAYKLLAPWLGNRNRFSTVFSAYDNGPESARLFFSALRSLVEADTPLTFVDVDRVACLASVLPNTTAVVDCFVALKTVGLDNQYITLESIRCAYRLRNQGVDFGRCVAALERMETQSLLPVTRTVEALHASGQISIAAHLIRHEEYGLLIATDRRVQAHRSLIDVQQLPAIDPFPQRESEWIQRYPIALQEALRTLASATIDAERIARRVLAKDLPMPESIATEIEALQKLLRINPDNPPLQSRFANLRARQASSPTISPVRLDKLRTRLELNASRLVLEHWVRQIEEQVHAKLLTLLGISHIPDWLCQESNLRLVVAICKLEGRVRELGLRLIRRRCGQPPWDFHHEPSNQEFLKLLRKRGINPAPLVDPPADIFIQNAKGGRYQLGIERDPLEVLRMGELFDTCLSPDGCNFFSTIVNAVDINKQVIYAWDIEGKIIGRCLLAVTDQGRILTFHIYCNIKDFDLHSAVRQYVGELARSMGTYVAKSGTVPTLVGPKWYDDGPQDLGSQFDFLAHDSAFRALLATMPLPDLLPTIRAVFTTETPDDLILSLVLELDEFDKRPELILPLIPLLELTQQLPETLRWRAAARAYKAGRLDFANRELNGRKLTLLVQSIERHGVCPCCSEPALRTLVDLDPTTVLRSLRLTREKGVHSDEVEYDSQRRYLLASAHSRLGRDALAGRLRRSKSDSN